MSTPTTTAGTRATAEVKARSGVGTSARVKARAATMALVLAAGCAALFAAAQALAEPLDGVLEVRSAYVNVDKGVFQLNARIEYPMNEQIQQALKDGVTLIFDLQVAVKRHRRLWFDADVLELTRRRELVYQAVSERYVVRDLDTGAQDAWPTLEEGLQQIGAIDAWPIVVESQLIPSGSYEISVRASVRRGRLPDALRTLMFWSDSWHRASDWYSWSLAR
jgi:hypothetical protein